MMYMIHMQFIRFFLEFFFVFEAASRWLKLVTRLLRPSQKWAAQENWNAQEQWGAQDKWGGQDNKWNANANNWNAQAGLQHLCDLSQSCQRLETSNFWP